MTQKEPLHKIAQSWATTISLILIPFVLAYMGNSYQEEMSRQKLNSEYITLAISILKEQPTPDTKELRAWAIDIIDHYSEIKLTPELRDSLTDTTDFGSSRVYIDQNGFMHYIKEEKKGILETAKDFLGTPYGLGSETK